ncbi:MAG: hypothetical protein GX066_02025 [Clostridiaceae bacterium]|nr:hypothetical protein [Clostridiaceae bacterium]
MYKETVKREGNSFLMAIGLVVLLFVFMSILDPVFSILFRYRIIADLIKLALFVICGYVVLRYFVAYFEYTIIDTDLIFHKIIGNRETVVLGVNTKDIRIIAPLSSSAIKKYGTAGKYDVSITLFGRNKYCVIFERQGKNYKLIIEPSESFIQALKKSIPDKFLK